MNKAKIAGILEVLGSFLSKDLGGDSAKLTDNPKEYLYSQYNISFTDDHTINVVENTEQTVHLALPYYGALQDNSAVALSDDELRAAGGIEIWVTCLIIGVVVVPPTIIVAVTAGAIGGLAASFDDDPKKPSNTK